MKLVYISNEQLLPLLGGGSAGNLHLMEQLAARGHKLTVITPLFVDPKPIEVQYGIRVRPFSPFYMHRTARFQVVRYATYATLFPFHFAKVLKEEGPFDGVVLRNCILAGSVEWVLRHHRIPLAISMTDVLSGFLYEGKRFPKEMVNRLVAWERKVAMRADCLLAVSEAMKQEITQGRQREGQVVGVTYDGVDAHFFDPGRFTTEDSAAVRRQLGVNGPLAMYHGIIDPYHGISVMKALFREALAETNLEFLVVAKGEGYDRLKAEFAHPRMHFLDFMPYEEIPRYIYAADAGFIPYLPNFNLDKVLTLKLLEYLSMGQNVVCFPLRTICEVFGNSGYVHPEATPAGFVRALVKAAAAPRSEAAVERVRKDFTWDVVTRRQCDLIEESFGQKT